MMRLIILFLFFVSSAIAQNACTAGTGSHTYDSGLVTGVCTPTTPAGNCTDANLGQYSTNSYTAMPGMPKRCMQFYYNTADGINNTNDTLVMTRPGGNVNSWFNGTLDWGAGFDLANGSQPNWVYAMVDGAVGKHFNVVFLQKQLSSVGQLSASLNSSSCSFTVQSIVGAWPITSVVSSNYVIVTQTGEQILVATQTGTNYGSSYAVTGCTRGYNSTTATSHSANEYFWPADTTGKTGAYPSELCDYVTALSYLAGHMGNTHVPGRKDRIWLFGWSDGAFTAQIINQIGHSLLATYGATACNSEWTNNDWVIQGAWMNSTKTDAGATATITTWLPSAPSPFNGLTADGSEPETDAATTGPNSSAPASYASISLTGPYTSAGIPVTTPNSAYQQAWQYSPQQCQPTYRPNCAVTPDPAPAREYVNDGVQDVSLGALQQYVFSQTTSIPLIYVQNVAPAGHTANFGTGTGCTISGTACVFGPVMTAMTRFVSYGGVPSVSSGSGGGVF